MASEAKRIRLETLAQLRFCIYVVRRDCCGAIIGACVIPKVVLGGDGKVVVYFLFTEYPRTIQEIKYTGLKHFKPDEMNTLTGLRVGGMADRVDARRAWAATTPGTLSAPGR